MKISIPSPENEQITVPILPLRTLNSRTMSSSAKQKAGFITVYIKTQYMIIVSLIEDHVVRRSAVNIAITL